jgi:hypothetical protein
MYKYTSELEQMNWAIVGRQYIKIIKKFCEPQDCLDFSRLRKMFQIDHYISTFIYQMADTGHIIVWGILYHILYRCRTITFKKCDFAKKKLKNSIFGQFLPILVTKIMF